MEKIAVIYARYSSDMQTENSIEAQVYAIRSYAEKNGFTIAEEYIDRAKSGTTTAKREEFQRMMTDSRKKKFDYVLVHKFDRFARNRYDSAIAKRELRMNGIQLISVAQPLDNSPESIILESLLEGMAEYYSANLSREVMKGYLARARKSLHNGGIPPLGYDVDRTTETLVINENEAPIVQKIFELYTDGYNYVQIIAQLNELGYKTKLGNEFGKNSLYKILRNKKYCGYYVYNRGAGKDSRNKFNRHKDKPDDDVIEIKGGVPALVTEDVFNKARNIMDRHKRSPAANSARHTYLLSGYVVCGHCGCSMNGNARINGKGNRYCSYRCTHKQNVPCINTEIHREKLEEFVLSSLEKSIFNLDSISAMAVQINNYKQQNEAENEALLIEIENRISALKSKRLNITNAIANGCDMEDFKDVLDDIRNELATLDLRKEQLSEPQEDINVDEAALYAILSQYASHIRSRDIEQCKKFIGSFIEGVTVYRDKVEVTMRIGDDVADCNRTLRQCQQSAEHGRSAPKGTWGCNYHLKKSINRQFLKKP